MLGCGEGHEEVPGQGSWMQTMKATSRQFIQQKSLLNSIIFFFQTDESLDEKSWAVAGQASVNKAKSCQGIVGEGTRACKVATGHSPLLLYENHHLSLSPWVEVVVITEFPGSRKRKHLPLFFVGPPH